MTKPGPREVMAITTTAGVPVDNEAASRIANSVGPAFDGFAAIAGTLPFDLEPATYLLVRNAEVSK